MAIWNISSGLKIVKKKTLFLHHNLLDWCKSGKKEKRTPLTRKGGNNGCGCRRKSHSQGQ